MASSLFELDCMQNETIYLNISWFVTFYQFWDILNFNTTKMHNRTVIDKKFTGRFSPKASCLWFPSVFCVVGVWDLFPSKGIINLWNQHAKLPLWCSTMWWVVLYKPNHSSILEICNQWTVGLLITRITELKKGSLHERNHNPKQSFSHCQIPATWMMWCTLTLSTPTTSKLMSTWSVIKHSNVSNDLKQHAIYSSQKQVHSAKGIYSRCLIASLTRSLPCWATALQTSTSLAAGLHLRQANVGEWKSVSHSWRAAPLLQLQQPRWCC